MSVVPASELRSERKDRLECGSGLVGYNYRKYTNLPRTILYGQRIERGKLGLLSSTPTGGRCRLRSHFMAGLVLLYCSNLTELMLLLYWFKFSITVI